MSRCLLCEFRCCALERGPLAQIYPVRLLAYQEPVKKVTIVAF